MNLKNLSDTNLNSYTKTCVREETNATTKVLHSLREVERRRLFSKLKYKSLFDYAERELGYPGDQAYRRIAAMRLMHELPEIQEKIASGDLSLTHLNEAKRVFNKRITTREEKLDLLEQLSNTSTREAQKILVAFAPEAVPRDRVRPLTAELTELKLVTANTLDSKIAELVGLLAHSHPDITRGQLFELLVDEKLAELKVAKQPKNTNSKADLERQVWKRDGHRCVKCGSTHALEVDHIVPKALGGEESLENLRLLCRSCNQRSAIEVYGLKHMSRYLRDSSVAYFSRRRENATCADRPRS